MATITSAATGNASAGATWVGGVAPGSGDDVIIAGHTITLDVDAQWNSLTLNNVLSRLAYGGSGTRTLDVLGSIARTAVSSATVITLSSGQNMIVNGTHSCTGSQTQYFFTLNGSVSLTLSGPGGTTNSDLYSSSATGAADRLVTTLTATSGNALVTRGRFNVGLGSQTGASIMITPVGGGTIDCSWVGTSTIYSAATAKLLSSTATLALAITITGDLQLYAAISTTGFISISGTLTTLVYTGNFVGNIATNGGALLSCTTGTLTVVGKVCHLTGANSLTISLVSGILNYSNQTVNLGATEALTLYSTAGTWVLTDLVVNVSGVFVGLFVGSTAYSASGFSVTQNAAGAVVGLNFIPYAFTPYAGTVLTSGELTTITNAIAASTAAQQGNATAALTAFGVATTAYVSAGFTALNQSASRRIVLATSAAFEIPDSGSTAYIIELRTFDGDGAAIAATGTPTLTVSGGIAGSMNARLSAWAAVATGIYRATFTVQSTDATQQLTFDTSANLGDGTFSASFFSAITDSVAVDFTSSDRALLSGLSTRATELRLAKLDVSGTLAHSDAAATYKATGFASSADVLAQATAALNAISPTALARFVTIDTGETAAAAGSVASFGGSGGSGGGDSETLDAISAANAKLDSIALKTALINAGRLRVLSRVAGNVITAHAGDDHLILAENALTLEVDDDDASLYALLTTGTNQNVKFGAGRASDTDADEISATIPAANVRHVGTSTFVDIELPSAATAGRRGEYEFDIQITNAAGYKITPQALQGTLMIEVDRKS